MTASAESDLTKIESWNIEEEIREIFASQSGSSKESTLVQDTKKQFIEMVANIFF
jgi:hypothetical protein